MNARDPGIPKLNQGPLGPLPGHAQLDLEHFLPYRLSVLSNRVSGTIARIYTERFQLSITEWRVMAVLGRYPGLSANEVAQRTAMDKVAVSRAVARLLDAGRLDREIHGDDRRRSVLKLSEGGYRIYDEVAPLALAFERRLLDGIDDQERAVLFRLLDKLDELELRAEAEGVS
ncbi:MULTISPECIES: MarR family winged helix-turn-helix transcriptional regulator [Lysobacter]|jgi:DNA-binding MarR family transcriptional regulator|uniref:MarR family transcriptional regulator n=1 Tax=Lysobacter soli TaxID=453783 RepID=A0A3D8VHK2_9GAMM|nr:MarR family winged helix-turn-helix transcriptional regulator [Lysobacter soli]MDG2517023.1 MarR family winged helix-turn-helix transcriptional regulator [Lysobacter soli]RDY68779.1 MarR family transcriptional regulator [Lysobacter soli]UTA54239.1 MarR family winged helix-turn-helix transcriptional regulator [Lysobacter soli]